MGTTVPVSRPLGVLLSTIVAGNDLVGFSELIELLGVSRSTAARTVNRSDFPAPAQELASGRLWRRKEVIVWQRKNPPRPRGRPHKTKAD